jgi:hypothetical protein
MVATIFLAESFFFLARNIDSPIRDFLTKEITIFARIRSKLNEKNVTSILHSAIFLPQKIDENTLSPNLESILHTITSYNASVVKNYFATTYIIA